MRLAQREAKQINVKSICVEFLYTRFNEGIKLVVYNFSTIMGREATC